MLLFVVFSDCISLVVIIWGCTPSGELLGPGLCIYTYRERERDVYNYIYLSLSIYIYIYI